MVALKQLRDVNDRQSTRLLQQEFSLLAQVKHRCIVQVYEYLPTDKTLVMEYVHGVNLRDIIDELGRKKIRFPLLPRLRSGVRLPMRCFKHLRLTEKIQSSYIWCIVTSNRPILY